LWDEFIQKELWDEELNGGRHKKNEDNVALSILVKKSKGKV
jgi:hypothetical protein